MKLIDLYKEWMEKKQLSDNGLCNSLPNKYLFDDKGLNQFDDHPYGTFWAYPLTYEQQKDIPFDKMAKKFTPLRQTIVLLICAMNNEL